jgi:hypothetical protein
LASLSNFYANSEQIIGRVNRLIAVWPTDDVLPAEGYEHLKTNYKKLSRALKDVRDISEEEAKYANFCASPKSVTFFVSAIDSVLEKLNVLIALRQAPESLPQGKIVTPSIILDSCLVMHLLFREAKQAPATIITHYRSCVGYTTFDICTPAGNDSGRTFAWFDGPYSSHTVLSRTQGTQRSACEAIAITRRANSGVPPTCWKDSRRRHSGCR